MTNKSAFERAMKAVWGAYDETDSFDHGGMASHEIVSEIEDALAAEFKQNLRRRSEE